MALYDGINGEAIFILTPKIPQKVLLAKEKKPHNIFFYSDNRERNLKLKHKNKVIIFYLNLFFLFIILFFFFLCLNILEYKLEV